MWPDLTAVSVGKHTGGLTKLTFDMEKLIIAMDNPITRVDAAYNELLLSASS